MYQQMEEERKMGKSMRKWLILLLIVPALMLTVSCAKKSPTADTGVTSTDDAARRAELERQRLAEQKRMQEEALAEQQRRAAAAAAAEARNRFLNDDVYYGFDSAALSMEAQNVLNQKGKWLQTNPGNQVTVEGHCDERGTNAYNLALGDRRAQSAKKFLVKLGIADGSMTTVSYGEERPADPGHNEAAWSKNRRAHFVLK
jgi:peptidoglycan-associated lipoprotein